MNEIERKYLVQVRECSLPQPDDFMFIKQGYIVSNRWMEWRVRSISTIKKNPKDATGYSPYTTSIKFGNGFVRKEYEWAISEKLHGVLAKFVPQWVRKSRAGYGSWILDRFYGDLFPLMVVEREAPMDGWIDYPLPPNGITLIRDVTDEGTYAVKRLARMSPEEQKRLIIDEVADLGAGFVGAECELHSSEQSKELGESEVSRSSGSVQ